jgi:hypothetical protein
MAKTLMDAAPKTLVTGRVQFFPQENCGIGTQFYEAWLNARCDQNDHWQHIWRECVIPSPCWMMRTAELRQAGCFDNAVYPEDYDMAFGSIHKGFRWFQRRIFVIYGGSTHNDIRATAGITALKHLCS